MRPLRPESQPFSTVSTSLDLFEFQHLPSGVAAPMIFQSIMVAMLKVVPHVECYVDVILARSDTADCQRVSDVSWLDRLCGHGIILKMAKYCSFQNAVPSLAHIVTTDGIHPTEAKKAAIYRCT